MNIKRQPEPTAAANMLRKMKLENVDEYVCYVSCCYWCALNMLLDGIEAEVEDFDLYISKTKLSNLFSGKTFLIIKSS